MKVLDEAFNILNQDFNPHNISFNWDNQIDYIDMMTIITVSPTTCNFQCK